MTELLSAAAFILLALIAVGLVWLLRARSAADRLMVVQLAGTGGAAAALLFAVAQGVPSATDVALTLALLAGFASAALAVASAPRAAGEAKRREPS